MLAMLTEAWLNSGRRTGRTSGLCPEGKRRHRCDFPVAQAHAYRIREETCAAWPLGWVLMERKRGLKLRRKPHRAVRIWLTQGKGLPSTRAKNLKWQEYKRSNSEYWRQASRQ